MFSGVEKNMPEDVYNGVSPLWLVWLQRAYLRTQMNILHFPMIEKNWVFYPIFFKYVGNTGCGFSPGMIKHGIIDKKNII